ncbi:hypothetical protein AB0N73_12480 [Microbacterium sp. NPDC089189]|uniref:hypothetical protein n=1 Tax=Microbacterium sp. NPDC089189 TaxID=3154972 RepID=UPI0034361715
MTVARRTDAAAIIAGVALIVLPLVGLFFKIFWPGWYLFFLLFASPVLLVGYALQIVIAVTGFLTPRAVFRTSPARARALAAAWIGAVGIALTGLFFVDGGDTTYGSAFMYLIGADGDAGVSTVSTLISFATGAAWIGGWVWLVIEWIVALVRRRRAR